MRLISRLAAALALTSALFGGAPAMAADAPAAQAPSLTPEDAGAWLDGFMPSLLHTTRTPGAIVSIVKDGKLLLERGYGVADMDKRTPVDPQRTLFRPGSTSKLFTWTAVMQQVELGKLNLDADVNGYLDFRIPDFDGKPITLRQVMTHRAGFEETIQDLLSFDGGSPVLGDVLKRHIPARVYAPGTTAAYSNYATALAGYIVQRVSGEMFDAYIEKHIFQPLGMLHSSFRQPVPAALLPDLATGYHDQDKVGKGFEIVSMPPAGSLSSTADDMAKFMIAHLGQSPVLMKPETFKLMHARSVRGFPDLNGNALGFYEQDINGQRVIAHGGDTNYFHSDLSLFLDQGVGIFVSVNGAGKDGLGARIRDQLFVAFADRYFPGAKAEPKLGVDAATAHQHAALIAGPYVSTRRMQSTFLSLLAGAIHYDIGANADGSISFGLFGPKERYVEVQPFLWQQVGGHDRIQARIENGRVVRWSTDIVAFAFEFEPRTGLAATGMETPLLAVAAIVVLLTALAWPLQALLRRVYAYRPEETAARRSSRRWLGIAAWGLVVTLGLWTAMLASVMGLEDGDISTLLKLCQLAAWLGFIGAAAVSLWHAAVVWRGPAGRAAKAWSVLVALACLLLLWAAAHYHLLSFASGY